MTINNPEAFAASHWDWACLNGCFGDTKIAPTDVDGLVERKGWLLLLETKLPGVEIPEGQLHTFAGLIATHRFTIMVIWGHPGKPERMRIFTRRGADISCPANLKRLRHHVWRWFDFADSH